MPIISNIDSFLQHFHPELILLFGIVVLLLRSMFGKRPFEDRFPMLFSLIIFAVALWQTLCPASQTQGLGLFGGMLSLDPMAVFFKVIVLVCGLVITLFSDSSKDLSRSPRPEFYAFLLTLSLGLLVMVSANDLLVMYLAIEMASILSYVLTGYIANNARSDEAGLKYVFFGGLASGIMIFGMSLLYGLTGSLNLITIREYLLTHALNPEGWAVLSVTFIMVLAGLGYKMAIAPFHMWSPDVYEGAPMPVTAFLSVASKAAGFAITLRFFLVGFVDMQTQDWVALKQIDWQSLVSVLSMITMTLGNLVALRQTNIKRFLAYSSIAHAGYMLMGLAVQSTQGIESILLYFAVYLLMNLGAFLVAIYMANEFATENMQDYKGLSRRGGIGFLLSFCMAVFLLSLAGIPPFAGFIGKLYVFGAVVQAKLYVLAVVGVINSVVSLYYYVKLVKTMFFYEPDAPAQAAKGLLRFATVIPACAVLTFVFGIYFAPLVNWVKASAILLH